MENQNTNLDELLMKEVKALFEFVPASKLKRSLEDLFFSYIGKHDMDPEQVDMKEHIYYLLYFLDAADRSYSRC